MAQFVIFNQVLREFDGRGRLTAEWQEHDSAVNFATTKKVTYGYSEDTSATSMYSRLTSVGIDGAIGTTMSYGSSGADLNFRISRVSSVSANGMSEGYQYLGVGTVVARGLGNGLTLRHFGGAYGGTGEAGDQYAGLDRFGRPIGWQWYAVSGAVDFHRYGYDRNSNRLYRTNEDNHSFDELYHPNGASQGYDGLDQLTEFRRGVLSDTNSDTIPDTVTTAGRYEVWDDTDTAGNFWHITASNGQEYRTHNRQNEITELNSEAFAYDGNGNLIDDGFYSYAYDAWNRLVEMLDDSEDGFRYEYDALGRRITEEPLFVLPVGPHHLYYNDAWQVIHDFHPGPTGDPRTTIIDEFRVYLWSPVGSDRLVGRGRDLNDDTNIDERLYALQDAQGNVTALADTTGEVVERVVQDPYGDHEVKDEEYLSQQPSMHQWNYFHQGLRLDMSGEFYDNRHRFYSPTLMRFMQNDPIGLAPDQNMYRYVGNGPVSAVDPSGLDEHIGSNGLISASSVFRKHLNQHVGRRLTESELKALMGPQGSAFLSVLDGNAIPWTASTNLYSLENVKRSLAAQQAAHSQQGVLETAQQVLDILGTLDPTPISDSINGLLYILQGDWKWAGVSFAAAFLPYAGDVAKLGKYEVGLANALRRRSVIGDNIAIHHVGQAHAMEQLIPTYRRLNGPSIALPTIEHLQIPNSRGVIGLTPREVLANDIWNLRHFTNAPNSSLQELIRLNKQMYPGAFAK